MLLRFNEMAEPMQVEKNLLVKKNVILSRTRDLLLPKLISGEIDVSNFPEPVTD
jgi:type I restriction enzyme S subunit